MSDNLFTDGRARLITDKSMQKTLCFNTLVSHHSPLITTGAAPTIVTTHRCSVLCSAACCIAALHSLASVCFRFHRQPVGSEVDPRLAARVKSGVKLIRVWKVVSGVRVIKRTERARRGRGGGRGRREEIQHEVTVFSYQNKQGAHET